MWPWYDRARGHAPQHGTWHWHRGGQVSCGALEAVVAEPAVEQVEHYRQRLHPLLLVLSVLLVLPALLLRLRAAAPTIVLREWGCRVHTAVVILSAVVSAAFVAVVASTIRSSRGIFLVSWGHSLQ